MTDAPHPCPICPACHSHKVTWLEAISRDTEVHYCRCDVCFHVFSVTRDVWQKIRDITPRRDEDKTG